MTNKRILVVDDELDLLKAIRIRLTSLGYDVITATTGEEAIRIAKKERKILDAIVLDIMIPGMDGIKTLKRVRRFNKTIPVLMFTAYGDEKKFEKARKLGISGFVHKGRGVLNASEAIHVVLRGVKNRGKDV